MNLKCILGHSWIYSDIYEAVQKVKDFENSEVTLDEE